MPLSVGTKLGPYEILAPLGAGGMGEVYRARDSKLGRQVAIKVLPDAVARDPERLARFEREAKMLASLNHPNIATIYGVEGPALVMELVEGETLAGRLPIGTALNQARQIAEALEYAHERGIIHRDLKPANIKVTSDGVVKLLDFGLAKAIEDPAEPSDPSNSPTLTLGHTRAGVIMGTAAYMSPEQAHGKPADRRSDIFSFGAVVYEMLVGRKTFTGESVGDTLASVLKLEPDWKALPPGTPPATVHLLQRCLTKDRKQRLQAIGEARIALERPAAEDPAPRIAQSRFGTVVTIAAGALFLIAATLGWISWRATRLVDHPLVRLNVDLGPEVALAPVGSALPTVILSPDGTRLVYVSGDPRRLYIRRLDQSKANELPGTNGAFAPFFDPDGRWVGFGVGTKLNKISIEGGAVVPITDIPYQFAGASWGKDGSIIIGQGVSKGLMRILPGGGTTAPLTELGSDELYHEYPQLLPGGKAVLFVAFPKTYDPDQATIEAFVFADRRRHALVKGTSPHYLSSGHLLYSKKGTLFAIPFDSERFEIRGPAVPMIDDAGYALNSSFVDVDSAADGTLVYRRDAGGREPEIRIVQLLDAAGARGTLLTGAYAFPRISPDGKRLAIEVPLGGTTDVRVYDQQQEAWTRLTFGGPPNITPVWSPDGRYVVFGSSRAGLSWSHSDGSGQPQLLMQTKNVQLYPSFAPDGKHLAYCESNGAQMKVWITPLEDSGGQLRAPGQPEQFLKDQFNDSEPAFSPDGRWLAYDSDESGKNEVYVRAFPLLASGQGAKVPISNNGGSTPRWSSNGRDLLYQSRDQIMAVSYTVKGDSFLAIKPRVWLAKAGGTFSDLSPDGKSVLVVTSPAAAEAPKPDHEVTFLFNFLDELRRRVPTGK
jgi:Tol biopolymer transport system component